MRRFNPGDIFVAYLKRKGFVGIGRIITRAEMIADVRINGKPLLKLPFHCKDMGDNSSSSDRLEYVCLVHWIKAFPKDKAKQQASPKLYTTSLVRASIAGQPKTIKFIEEQFGVCIKDLIV